MYILGLSKKLVDTANIIQNNDTFFKKVLSYLNIDLNYVYVKKNRTSVPAHIGVTVTYLIIFTMPIQNTQLSLAFIYRDAWLTWE